MVNGCQLLIDIRRFGVSLFIKIHPASIARLRTVFVRPQTPPLIVAGDR